MRLALKLLSVLLVLALVALASLPGWLGWVLRPMLARTGTTYERYERVGYSRFALTQVRSTLPGVTFTAARTEADSPLFLLFRRGAVAIERWSVIITPAPPRNPNAAPASPARVHSQISQVTAALRKWVPELHARDGQLEVRGQTWLLPNTRWSAGALALESVTPHGEPVNVAVRETAERGFAVRADSPVLATVIDFTWSNAGRVLAGNATWHGQPLAFTAEFADSGWIPATADLRAKEWKLAAPQIPLPAGLAHVRGDAALEWRDGKFTLRAQAHGEPSRTNLPPLDLALEAHGDRTQATLQTVRLRAPFGDAQLTAPLTLFFDGRAPAESARLTVALDLSRQPWLTAAGRVAGELRVVPQLGQSRGEFALTVSGFAWRDLRAHEIALAGDWTWPRFRLTRADAVLDDASRLRADGEIDLAARELRAAHLEGSLAGATAAAWWPAPFSFDRLAVRVEADGPLTALRHRGELEATAAKLPRLRALALASRWQGTGTTLPEVSLTAQAGAAVWRAVGSLRAEGATLQSLTWEQDGAPFLTSTTSAEITWRPTWRVSGLRLEGREAGLALDATLGREPTVFFSAHQISSSLLQSWWEGDLPEVVLANATVRGDAREGVWVGEAKLEARARVDDTWLQVRLVADADRDRVLVQQAEVADARGVITRATGRFPVRVASGTPVAFLWDQAAPLELDLAVNADSPLWDLFEARTAVALRGASLTARAHGSLAEPVGELQFSADQIEPKSKDDRRLDAQITAVRVALAAQRDGLQVTAAEAQVNGQPIRATARIPLDRTAWRKLATEPAQFPWRSGEAEVRADDVPLAAIARTFPALPLTQGVFSAQLAWREGKFTGRTSLRDGASRPLPGFGRLLGISADLALEGTRCEIRQFSGLLGGEPVQLSGTAALGDDRQLELDLRLQARNVPLVRRPGLLVRTDIDLTAKTPDRGPTRLSGTVELRDALVLADLATILPGGPRGVARTPPYFSIETEPFSRWPLDVRLTGNRAVRVRTAVFNGVATPQFHLVGTLGDPRAIGQLALDEGQAIFPFARFAVQQGAVRLTEADPTQPQLAAQATAQRLGYELRLEVGGTLAAPTLAFSSNPPLESADILLLVTAGQPPKEETAAPTGTQRLTRLGTFLGRGLVQNLSGEDRLEITSGEQLSEAGRETYRVEYKLGERWSLQGEYDRYDDYNAGLKYRLYTQEGAPREQQPK